MPAPVPSPGGQSQLLSEIPVNFKRVRASRYDLRGFEGDVGIVLDIKEILAFQLAIFNSASGVQAAPQWR